MSASAPQQPVAAAPVGSSAGALSAEGVRKWELGVSLLFHNWKVLSDAVAGEWGGPDSGDKRDWLCGAIADMFTQRDGTDEYDVEETLVHVMEDEYMVNLEDDSAFEIARKITALRKEMLEGNFATVDELHAQFLCRPRYAPTPAPVREVVHEAGSSASGDEDSEDEDSDDEMGEAPPAPLVRPRERVQPILDEDGFELVQKKR